MKPKTKRAIKKSTIVAVLLCSVFIAISLLSMEKTGTPYNGPESLLTDDVKHYKPLVEKYAEKYGVTAYTDVLLAMMMQESAGRGDDPMQSSESYCGEVGCIEDPELSIKQGVDYFSQTLKSAKGDLELAIQSYNFGKGFIDFVLDNNGKYTQEAAIDFSREMYESAENKTIYTCLREEAKAYNACYGDIYYVRDVMKYKEEISGS